MSLVPKPHIVLTPYIHRTRYRRFPALGRPSGRAPLVCPSVWKCTPVATSRAERLRCGIMRSSVWLVSAAVFVSSSIGCTTGTDRTEVTSSTSVSGAPSAGGVTLVAPTSKVLDVCQTAADRLDRQIPCPSLLPEDPYHTGAATSLREGSFFFQRVFQGPESYVGMPNADGSVGSVGHLNIWSIPRRALDSSSLGCAVRGRPVGAINMDGTAARWIACPAGRSSPEDSGHIMLQWSSAGIVYAVSVHTNTRANRRLALFIATHLNIVEPPR